jgi:hypothetical protein
MYFTTMAARDATSSKDRNISRKMTNSKGRFLHARI